MNSQLEFKMFQKRYVLFLVVFFAVVIDLRASNQFIGSLKVIAGNVKISGLKQNQLVLKSGESISISSTLEIQTDKDGRTILFDSNRLLNLTIFRNSYVKVERLALGNITITVPIGTIRVMVNSAIKRLLIIRTSNSRVRGRNGIFWLKGDPGKTLLIVSEGLAEMANIKTESIVVDVQPSQIVSVVRGLPPSYPTEVMGDITEERFYTIMGEHDYEHDKPVDQSEVTPKGNRVFKRQQTKTKDLKESIHDDSSTIEEEIELIEEELESIEEETDDL